MDYTIGIDIGGTNLRVALVSRAGQILLKRKMPVGTHRSMSQIIDYLTSAIESLRQESSPKKIIGVGMGVPGIVGSRKGIVYASPHFPAWKNFFMAKKLSQKIDLPVVIDNDVNMIASGEAWKGSGKDWPTFLMITLGTGVGGALIINSQIFQGTEGFAGEVGHMVVESNGHPCACGSKGCLEAYTSATALIRMIKEKVSHQNSSALSSLKELLTAEEDDLVLNLKKLAQKGNPTAKAIFQEMGYYLGIGFASLINVTGIQNLVVGGGVSGAHRFFIQIAKNELKKRTYAQTFKGVKIRLARLGDDAGVLGSAFLAFDEFKNH